MKKISFLLFTLHFSLFTYSQSIDSVLNVISENNLQLKALVKEHEAEVSDMKGDNLPAGPDVEYTPSFASGVSGLAESELNVTEEIDFPTKYIMRKKQMNLRQQTLQRQYESTRAQILLDARLLCLDIIRANQMRDMLGRRLADSEKMLELLRKRLDAGDANILELKKVELERMDVQKMVSNVEGERLSLVQQLQLLNGGKAIDVTQLLFPENDMEPDFESFRENAILRNSDIQASTAEVKASGHEISMARQEWLPNLRLGYRRDTALKDQVHGVTVAVSFPIVSTTSKVRAAKSRQEASELQLQQIQNEADQQLRSLYDHYVTLQQVLNHEDVEMMNSTLDLLSKALQHGEISAIQYYNEIDDIYDKLQSHIDTHCQSCKLYAQMHKY